MKTTVIFDLDGTLLDTIGDLKNSVNYALKVRNLPEKDTESIRKNVGNGIKNLVRGCLPSHFDENVLNDVVKDMLFYYEEHYADESKPYPGVIEMLERLKRKNFKIAICSNKSDFLIEKISRKFFSGLVDYSLGEIIGYPRKPEPDMVNRCLSVLNSNIDNAVYVGDSEVDIKTAQNAGIDFEIVSWGFRNKRFLLDSGAKSVSENCDDLLKRILK